MVILLNQLHFQVWLDIVKITEGYAEVVSYDEYNLVLKCGFDKSHIIYNGPMKDKASFIDALENGAIVNIETKRELDWLLELIEINLIRLVSG